MPLGRWMPEWKQNETCQRGQGPAGKYQGLRVYQSVSANGIETYGILTARAAPSNNLQPCQVSSDQWFSSHSRDGLCVSSHVRFRYSKVFVVELFQGKTITNELDESNQSLMRAFECVSLQSRLQSPLGPWCPCSHLVRADIGDLQGPSGWGHLPRLRGTARASPRSIQRKLPDRMELLFGEENTQRNRKETESNFQKSIKSCTTLKVVFANLPYLPSSMEKLMRWVKPRHCGALLDDLPGILQPSVSLGCQVRSECFCLGSLGDPCLGTHRTLESLTGELLGRTHQVGTYC